MVSQKVNGVSLKQAVEEFGSLQKAINSLKTQKKALQTDLLALTRDIDSKEEVRVKYLDDLNHLKKTIEERKQNLDDSIWLRALWPCYVHHHQLRKTSRN